jgi:hypothetical protein
MNTITIPLRATLLTLGISGPSARAANVIETRSSTSNYSTFSSLLAQSGLVETVRSLRTCTVFVPVDSAFRRLTADQRQVSTAAETIGSIRGGPDEGTDRRTLSGTGSRIRSRSLQLAIGARWRPQSAVQRVARRLTSHGC